MTRRRGAAAEAFKARDLALDRAEHELTRVMVGRSVVSVEVDSDVESCISANVVRLKLDDGTTVKFTGGYDDDADGTYCCSYSLETLVVEVRMS